MNSFKFQTNYLRNKKIIIVFNHDTNNLSREFLIMAEKRQIERFRNNLIN
jgi:hypothetical protein